MTKKVLMYVFTAVLLGAVMMILPQWIFWVSYATSGEVAKEDAGLFMHALSSSPKEWLFSGVPEKPSYEETASYGDVWIFLVSFVLALAVRFLYKRRAPYPHYQMPPL